MDLRELRKKIAELINEAELSTEITIECQGNDYKIENVYFDEENNLVIIETE